MDILDTIKLQFIQKTKRRPYSHILTEFLPLEGCPLGYVMYLEYSMMFIFSEMIENGMEIILDDFSVLGSIYDQCLETLDRVLKRCESYNLVLN